REPRVRPKTAAAALAEILALEEKLGLSVGHVRVSPAPAYPSGVRKKEMAIDGLPGALPGGFAEEVSSHLSELRRTGSMSTTDPGAGAKSSQPEPMANTERAPQGGAADPDG